MRYCHVALPRPLRQTFVYELPPELREAARPGARVLVPFRNRTLVGCIDRLGDETDLSRVRRVEDLLDEEPLLPEPLVPLCRWIAHYYVAPPGMVLRAALPPGLLTESSYRIGLTEAGRAATRGSGGGPGSDGGAGRGTGGEDASAGEGPDPDRDGGGPFGDAPTDAGRAVLGRLRRASGPLRATTLRDAAGTSAIWPALRALEEEGLVRVEEEPPEPEGPSRSRQVVRLVRRLPTLSAREDTFGRAERQREAYETLESMGGRAEVAHMANRLGFSRSVVRGLEEKGVAEIREEEERRDPFGDLPVPDRPDLEPTDRQAEIIGALRERAGRDEPGVTLLRGVTGSGKTLVYLEVMKSVVEAGRSAVVLVPEISLTPQTVQRFRAVFGDRVALLHSGLSAGERWDEWRALREGAKRVAVGARSAVFAPVDDLGLLVVDEEHEGSYKQSDVPRYHARAVAAMRCRMEDALCVLGSATPSLESWHNARTDLYRLHELPDRVTAQPLPEVTLVDLRAEREKLRNRSVDRAGGPRRASPGGGPRGDDGASGGGGASARGRDGKSDGTPETTGAGRDGARGAPPGPLVVTPPLRDALAGTLGRDEQAILLLNRRGYSSYVQCRECGKVWSCGSCNVTLTYHRGRSRIVCHHCGHHAAVPRECDECGATSLAYSGLGTEQVERRVGELFPDARVVRMDVDTTGTKWAHFDILERMRRREIDVLLGTQMIAKGLDFPNVTLVGVVNADVGLNLPDFRASERTFQLLSQVAGRAGRGDRPGRVLVQTSRPDHFALGTAVDHDYEAFAEREAEDREGPGYPPHRRLANLTVTGESEDPVADAAVELAGWTRDLVDAHDLDVVDVVGPAPCVLDRVRGRWRWHFLLKSDRAGPLGAVLRHLDEVHGQPSGDLRLEIDRDPESLL